MSLNIATKIVESNNKPAIPITGLLLFRLFAALFTVFAIFTRLAVCHACTGRPAVVTLLLLYTGEREYRAVKKIYLNKTISNLLSALGFGLLDYFFQALQSMVRNADKLKTMHGFYTYLLLVSISGIAIFGRMAFKAFKLYVQYRDISKDLKNIAEALLDAMVNEGLVTTAYDQLSVIATISRIGDVSCYLEGATTFEHTAFINMLQEIVSPVDNPRYIIIRKSRFMRFAKQQDFHAVPEQLGRNKSSAEHFKVLWEKHVGRCELVFTRTMEGRRLLLKSRLKSLASQFDTATELISKWN